MPSDFNAKPLACNANGPQAPPTAYLEQAARSSMETRFGRKMTDLEWDRTRSALLEYVNILRRWHQEVVRRQFHLANAS